MALLGKHILVNGVTGSPAQANIRLDDPDLPYGYGCYEVLKLRKGRLYFPEFHEERLLHSTALLGFRHNLQPGFLAPALQHLIGLNGFADSNIRVLLIAHQDRLADWYAFQVPPLVPPPGAPQHGVACLLYHGERTFPAAKSLNLLMSTIAFREAQALDCYDALLVGHDGMLTEGTRTNLFWLDEAFPHTVFTTPLDRVLSGVTRRTLRESLLEAAWSVEETLLSESALLAASGQAAGSSKRLSLFITSTSSLVLPICTLIAASRTVGYATVTKPYQKYGLPVSAALAEVQEIYRQWLDNN
ncbi:MAG: aminotransferase class IV [Spirochaetes bacterium]|nr:aminotransferase class IV [Spirochaetota bacterium]MBU0956237.1 aminotransferase class IV [Spirochaetota bacterium]